MLNPNEKIDSWVITVRTADNTPGFTDGRTFTLNELGIDLPDSITQPVDEIIESLYPVTWQD